MYSKCFRTVEIYQDLSAVDASEMSAQCLSNKPNAQVPVALKGKQFAALSVKLNQLTPPSCLELGALFLFIY